MFLMLNDTRFLLFSSVKIETCFNNKKMYACRSRLIFVLIIFNYKKLAIYRSKLYEFDIDFILHFE